MNIELVCDGEVVNKHSEDWNGGWCNPLETVPPLNSIIEYMTFNQNHKENEGVLTRYIVKGFIFTTEEDFNSCYRNTVCKVILEVIE